LECGFKNYASSFECWNKQPNETNVDGVRHALQNFEQKLKEKYSAEPHRRYQAKFWHGLGKTTWETFALCHIEAHGDPLKTAIGLVDKIPDLLPSSIKTVLLETAVGSPEKGVLKAATEVLRDKKDKKYEQFALYPIENTHFVSLHRNIARN
jgi:hypothetical protein